MEHTAGLPPGGTGRTRARPAWHGAALAIVVAAASATPAGAVGWSGPFDDCTVLGTPGNDVLEAVDPRGDVVCGLGGDDVLIGGPGDDRLRGGRGHDTVAYSRAGRGVRVDLGAGAAAGHGNDSLRSIERVLGSGHADVLIGNRRRNSLLGGSGRDRLFGRGGADFLDGGPGRDTLDLSRSRDRVLVDLRAGRARGEGRYRLRRLENVIGSRLDDVLSGDGRPNVLSGRRGVDTIEGRGGTDRLYGGADGDTLLGGSGRDRLRGGRGVDSCLQGEETGGSKRSCEALGLGSAAGVTAFSPARRPVGVGFHESLFDSAADMRPHGSLGQNDNPRKFRPPPPSDGHPHVVMSSRGRRAGATTAADVVARASTPIRAPVNGRVVLVRHYRLYCEAPDIQVFIRPDGHPSIRVAVFHLTDIRVRRGDRVVASATILGRAREFEGSTAQENQYFPGPYPHVHLEIERRRAMPVPGCA